MACDDRQLTEAQRAAGYQNQRTGVQRAIRPFTGSATVENLIDYVNRELCPAVRASRDAVNDVYLQVTDNAPSGNPLGFYFSTETAAADPTAGRIRANAATQDTATILRVSESNGRLVDVAPWLDVMAGGATTPLGVVTLTDAINPARFIRFDLTSMTDAGAYWNLAVTPIESSHDNPFVDGGAVVLSFIPAVASSGVTIPPGAITPVAANTVIANATAAIAAPTAFPVGTNTVLGRVAGNIVAAQLVNAQMAAGAVGTVKGRQIDAVSAAVADLTGAEQGENLRFNTRQTVSGASGTLDIALNDDTTILTIQATGNCTLRSLGSTATGDGRPIRIEFEGSAFTLTIAHNGATPTFAPFFCPHAVSLVAGHAQIVQARSRSGFWRPEGGVGDRYTAGLSVLGRTGTTAGPAVDITATGRRQVVNTGTAGTSVSWGTLGTIMPGAPIYDVMAPPFNATGDGVADDTAALNAAIAAANASSGAIYLGAAHRVTSALTAITGRCIFIVGRGPRTGGSRIIASGATPFDVVTFDSSTGSGMERVLIVGPGTWASAGYGVVINLCLLTRIFDCEITGTYGAVHIRCSVITELIRTYASAILGPVGFYAHGDVAVGENHALTFNACACGSDVTGGLIAWYKQGSFAHTFEMLNCGALTGGYGLLVEDDAPATDSEPKFTRGVNFQIDHPGIHGIALLGGAAARFTHTFITSVDTGDGVHIADTYGGNWEFTGGEISNVDSGHGIYVGASYGSITGMQIGDLHTGSDCIHVAAGVEHLNIVGNACGEMRGSGAAPRYGINIESGCDNFVVVGNRCLGNNTGSILNDSGTSVTRVVRDNIPVEPFVDAKSLAPGTHNNLAVDSRAEIVEVTPSSAGDVIITGFAVDGGNEGRKFRLIQNGLVGRVMLNNNSGSSTSGNRIINANLNQLVIEMPGAAVDMVFNDNTNFWYSGREGLRIRRNSTGSIFSRNQINFIEGTGISIAIASDAVTPETDITITGGVVSDGDKGDVTVSGTGTVWTIDNNVVTDAKLRDSAGFSVIGRAVTGTGDPADIPIADNSVLGRAGAASTGDVEAITVPGTGTLTGEAVFLQSSSLRNHVRWGNITLAALPLINNDRFVGNISGASSRPIYTDIAQLAQDLFGIGYDSATHNFRLTDMAQSTIKGRAEGAGTGVPTDLTPTQVVSIIDGETVTWTGSHTFNGTNLTVTAGADVAITASGGTVTLAATTQVQITSPTRLASSISFDSVGSTATPAADNLAINSVNVVRFTGPANPLTGMVPVVDGQTVLLVNAHASNDLVILLNATGSSTAANCFSGVGTDRHVKPGEMAMAWYDGNDDRWRLLCRDEVDL